jgi:tRNA-Thr(GGU) m(6)t(6)A37 methyltransferase TsaA
MSEKAHGQEVMYQLYPLGHVRRNKGGIHLEIGEAFRPALKQLEQFSHVVVFWWADQFDNAESRNMLQTRPPYAEKHVTGVFATRSPYRPNPIAITTCKLLGINEQDGIVRISNIDAFDGTPVVDLKAYFPVCDQVKEAHIPEWLSDWPEWMPDEGLGLEPWEE